MVKVQKPQPKSLSKTQKIEGVAKEKFKATKEKKSTKASAALASASADVSEIKTKIGSKKSEGKNALEKKSVNGISKGKPAAVKEKSKPSKKALVLAPSLSPAAPAPKTKGGKKKLASTAPPSPVAPAPKPKAGKKKLVLAAPPSPVVPAPKSKGAKKLAAVPAPENVTPKETKAGRIKKSKDIAKPSAPVKEAVEKKAKKQVAVEKKSTKKEKQPEIITQAPKSVKVAKSAKKTIKSAKQVQNKQTEVVKESKKTVKNPSDVKKAKPVTKKVARDANNKGKGKDSKKQKRNKKNLELNKKPKKVVELGYELKPFDEDKFFDIVSESKVHKICDALQAQVSEEVNKKKTTSIFSDYRYILQVSCYKIPSCPKRLVKLALKNPLIAPNDDVAIIVPDLQRGARFEYEPTVQHYEDLFREAGVEQRLSIVPFNRLRNDMGTFEAKRKFLNSYDYFLCDGRISGQASAFLGQAAQKPRNVLHAVRLSKDNQLPKEISRALSRTAYRQLRKGDLTAIPVGIHEHSGLQLAENIMTVIKQLQQQYPGGLANIRSMYLKIDIVGTSALPLYISLCSPPADTPYVVGPREQRMLKLKKQANEVLSKFALTKDVGFVKLTGDQVKYKAEVREKRLALKAAESAKDNEEEEAVVPAKKARKEAVTEPVEAEADDDEDENEDEVDEDDEEDDENDDDDDENDDDDDDDDDDDEDDDDDDEDEEE